jgi:hypothetical protein
MERSEVKYLYIVSVFMSDVTIIIDNHADLKL